jgi:hypothetical protein
MKLSIFTTQGHTDGEFYSYGGDSLECYGDLADEVIIVDGSNPSYMDGKKTIDNPPKGYPDFYYYSWSKEFSWEFIGQQFQRGYEACTGDWVIHADLDFIFHERDFKAIRQVCESNPNAPALSFWKYQFILPDRYNLKSRLVIAVNKGKFGDRIKFNSGGDLCQPSLDGKEIKPEDVPEARIPFYNYEKLTKTKAQIKDDVERMDRAYKRHFGHYLYSATGRNNEAYNGWLEMVCGRFNKPQEHIKLEDHPKYIQETIENLTPDQFGFNGLGHLKESDYAQNSLRS